MNPQRRARREGEAERLRPGAVTARSGRRTWIASDFLIGAHAWSAVDHLLTRDLDFYRRYFAGIKVSYAQKFQRSFRNLRVEHETDWSVNNATS